MTPSTPRSRRRSPTRDPLARARPADPLLQAAAESVLWDSLPLALAAALVDATRAPSLAGALAPVRSAVAALNATVAALDAIPNNPARAGHVNPAALDAVARIIVALDALAVAAVLARASCPDVYDRATPTGDTP